MAHSPVIGVTAYREQAKFGQWDTVAVLLSTAYISSVRAGGGVPVLLPPEPGTAEALVGRLDGLILAGGPDVAPERYGAVRHEATGPTKEDRDDFELELIHAALKRNLPTLAICRGLQLLNVARGGTLLQHLPDVVGHNGHDPREGDYGSHGVRIEPGTLTAEALGVSESQVLTHHHQAVESLGSGLISSAWSEDGLIEAVEDPTQHFLIGVQWHPEVGDDPSLFRALARTASCYRQARS